MITYDFLLPTIPHRHEQMCTLLAEINRQWQPGLGMLVKRDNLERPGDASYAKWQELEEASQAEYTSFIADDDWIAPDFVHRIMTALQEKPDYVGFPVKYTSDGVLQLPVEHSLRHGTWANYPHLLARDIVHHNPIRRDLALLVKWRTENCADRLWAEDLRATGRVLKETWISDQMYYYRETSKSWSRWSKAPAPMPVDDIPAMPQYPWLSEV